MNRQGNDSGTQYRSGIYYTTPEQKEEADGMIRQMSQDKLFGKPIVTEVLPLANYWPAEDYHQDFFEKNPNQGYCVAVAGPKVAKFRKTFADLVKRLPVIETRALRYDYPRGPSLAFPDLDVPQGATLLLRGNSGAGKSTWLALAAGLLTASAGEVAVAGQPLSALSRTARDGWRARHLGFLPQKLHLSDALSVERNLALAFYAAGLPMNRQRGAPRAGTTGRGRTGGPPPVAAVRRPGPTGGAGAQHPDGAQGDPGRRTDGEPG